MGSVGSSPKEAKQLINNDLVLKNLRVGHHERKDVSVRLDTALARSRSSLGDVVFDQVTNGQTIFLHDFVLTWYLENPIYVRVKPVYGALETFVKAETNLVDYYEDSFL